MEGKWVKAGKEGNSWFAKCPFCGHICEMVEDEDDIIITVEYCKHLMMTYDWAKIRGKWTLEMYFEQEDNERIEL